MNAPIDWLLEGEPWIEYRTRLDLLDQKSDDPLVMIARDAMLEDKQVRQLINELTDWPGKVIASHKSAGQSFHKLTFLADLGIKANDPNMDKIIARVTQNQSEEGPFQLPVNISASHGGTGEDLLGWALCDAPLIVYALFKFGLGAEPSVKKAIKFLTELTRDNGWPCKVSMTLGSFRGPGRKEDPCPYANLVMLKLLAEVEDYRYSTVCHTGAETLLNLWENSHEKHPYIFYMGTDFRKLKIPFVWYDLMHVLQVLSQFQWLKSDPRLLDMVSLLKSKMDDKGRFTVESQWVAWKDWEFGQKKEPSRWLTLMAWCIIQRVESRSPKQSPIPSSSLMKDKNQRTP
jgi:hypothetical protein